MKIKYTIKEFNPDIIQVGDWVRRDSFKMEDKNLPYCLRVGKIRSSGDIQLIMKDKIIENMTWTTEYLTKIKPGLDGMRYER